MICPDSKSFETGNHIKQEANGYHKTVLVPRLRSDGSKTGELDTSDIIVQSGSYSYISPDGTVISVQWFADENGFQAFGDHLPTPPPIPEPILQALQAQHDQPFDEEPIQQSQGNSHQSKWFKVITELLNRIYFNYNVDNAVTVPPTESPAQSEIVEKQRQQRSSFLPPLLQ